MFEYLQVCMQSCQTVCNLTKQDQKVRFPYSNCTWNIAVMQYIMHYYYILCRWIQSRFWIFSEQPNSRLGWLTKKSFCIATCMCMYVCMNVCM